VTTATRGGSRHDSSGSDHETSGGRGGAGERARGPLDPVLRVGWAAKGIVYGLIGVLALQVAFGSRSENADEEGALETVAAQPMGQMLLWFVAAGLVLYVVGRVLEAILLATDRPWHHRVVIGLSGLIHATVALAAARIAMGGGGGSDNEEEKLTARALELPAGQWLVGLAGLAVIAVGGILVWGAISKRYVDELDLDRSSGRARTYVIPIGFVGVAGRGAAVALLGWFLVHAALQTDPDETAGLDEALRQLAGGPLGVGGLALLAVGFMAFGAACLFHAHYRRA
jgi:hypothetical protein